MEQIKIRGARTHNLKNINLDLPRHKLVVITGLSGSGKSSLAFDTLYAEGQRRYVESLSAYARQFLQLMEKPDVDLIEGLSPAIAIEQKATSHNPRSTVGTVTEIHDYLRLLFARAGDPYCPQHDLVLAAQSVGQMVDHVLALPEGTKIMILSPLVVERKGEQLDLFDELRAQGFTRLRINGKVHEIDALPKLEKNRKHTVEIVVDRLKANAEAKQRLAESFETALRHADGRAIAVEMDTEKEHLFSAKFACPICSYSLPELEPRLFSFNNPMGACPKCDGLGVISFFDPKRIVAFPQMSLSSGAIKGWDRRNQFYHQLLASLAKHYNFDIEQSFESLPEKIQQVILYGSGKTEIAFQYLNERGKPVLREHAFEGIVNNLERRYKETDSPAVREELAKYLNSCPCPECKGTRLRLEARHVRVAEMNLYEISALPLKQALAFFQNLKLQGHKQVIAEKIVLEIASRLTFLNNVGLEYLSLERSAETLSGGEAQRIRLASQIGSGLTGVMYVLDEPSIGLHQRDNDRLLQTLKKLRDMGNSVIVVEHDEEAIRAADHVVDMGPGAGAGYGKGNLREQTVAHRRLPVWQAQHSRAGKIPQAGCGTHAAYRRRFRQQPERHHAESSCRPAGMCHRRIRLRQVHADQRHAVSRRRATSVRQQHRASTLRGNQGAGIFRQGDQRRSKPDWAHAALQSGHLHRPVHADSRTVRGRAVIARARLRAGTFLVQRQRRSLRILPGRRRHQGRDALLAGRICAVRCVPRPALQPRDAGGQLQGQKRPPDFADDRRAGA
jgi:excinuclease ABC subunit A